MERGHSSLQEERKGILFAFLFVHAPLWLPGSWRCLCRSHPAAAPWAPPGLLLQAGAPAHLTGLGETLGISVGMA